MSTLTYLNDILNMIDSRRSSFDSEGRLALDLVSDYVNDMIIKIETETHDKLIKSLNKFDENHNNYSEIYRRGHITETTHFEEVMSAYSMGLLDVNDTFRNFSSDEKTQVIDSYCTDKNNIEIMSCLRHGYEHICHTTGHDGIRPSGEVCEVKNHQYNASGGRFNLQIKFDRVSPGNNRKLDEGRPTIILNSTDNGKLLLEMKLKFTDELSELYKSKMNEGKTKSSTGITISFSDFEHAIEEVTFIHPNLDSFNFGINVLTYLNENYGTSYSTERKRYISENS